MTDHAIDVQNLTKRFGRFIAVNDLSFTVPRGEIYGFLGANGAGKSTTIRMLCGLLKPTSGSATVAGYDVDTQRDQLRRSIGYMSQRFSLYEDLSVEQNLRFYGGVYGLRGSALDERIGWAVGMADLTGREQSLTNTLSGGWRQRLALGCAILHRPSVLFLDEPTGGVDPISRRRFWELINNLSAEGVTVLVTTHFLDEAEYCNSIILIDAGRLIATGSPRELKSEHIRHPILEVSCSDAVRGLELIRDMPWAMEVTLFGVRLHVMAKNEADVRTHLPELLQVNGIDLFRIEEILPSLEDVFLFLLEKNILQGTALPVGAFRR